jgi:hypothetical protein
VVPPTSAPKAQTQDNGFKRVQLPDIEVSNEYPGLMSKESLSAWETSVRKLLKENGVTDSTIDKLLQATEENHDNFASTGEYAKQSDGSRRALYRDVHNYEILSGQEVKINTATGEVDYVAPARTTSQVASNVLDAFQKSSDFSVQFGLVFDKRALTDPLSALSEPKKLRILIPANHLFMF